MDLLHNTGNNQKVGGAYGAGSLTAGPAASPRLASDYVTAAQNSAPKPPTPAPAPRPESAKPVTSTVPAVATAQGGNADKSDKAPVPSTPPAPVPEPKPAPEAPVTPPPVKGGGGRKALLVIIVLLILAAIGGGVWWYLTQRNQQAETPQAPAPKAIEVGALKDPRVVDATGEVAPGKATKDHKLTFHAILPTTANTGSVIPEIEVRPMGQAFTGEPTTKGTEIKATGRDLDVSVAQENIVDGAYHWQIRVTLGDQKGDWLIVGDDKSPAFTVDSVAPAAPTVDKVGDSKVSGTSVNTTGTNRPVFSGKADPGATLAITVTPENIKLTATADGNGAWTVTPDQDIPNGQHNLSVTATDAAGNASQPLALALTVNPATAQTPTTPATPTPTTTTAPKKLAPTGDTPQTAIAFGMMLVAAAGFIISRRQGALR